MTLVDTSNSTGDPVLDKAIMFEIKRIRTFFGIHPGVRILNDQQSPNAYAIRDSLLLGTDGTVLLGRTLIGSELEANSKGGIAVAGIIAHECAHILQYNSSLYGRLTTGQRTSRCLELHADYMAGFYFGVRAVSKDLEVKPFAHSLFGKGDWAFNEPTHHGTPQEREAAMYAGFELGKAGQIDIMQAAERGVGYVDNA